VTTTSTVSLRDALDDLDSADLDTDTGRAHALNALDYLDRETDRIRDYITAREAQS
jgi:hypothetical protein